MPYLSSNPANGIIIQKFPSWNIGQLNAALEKTYTMQAHWREVDFASRAAILKRVAKLLRQNSSQYAALITSEIGKITREAQAEIEKSALGCDFYADHAEQFLAPESVQTDATKSYIRYEPLGTVLAIMSWNFPFWQIFRFAAPALIAGNACILKHAANVPQCATAIETLFKEAGLPEGIFSVVFIEHNVIEIAISHPGISAVTLTGSEQAGRKIAAIAGERLKKCVLELGGSDPFIVLQDADLEATVNAAIASRFQNCGQSCVAAKRFIVVPEIADHFMQAFKGKIENLKLGDPLDQTTDIGPMARADLREALHRQVSDAITGGAIPIIGCKPASGAGNFYLPSLIDQVNPSMRVFREELFGPVAVVIRAKDEEDALALASDTHYGLGASIWSRDSARAEQIAKKIPSGMAFVNGVVKSDPRLPFGGIKDSGYGRELSYHGIREFVNTKTIWIK